MDGAICHQGQNGRALGPIGIHAYYENSYQAIEMAMSHAETTIDAGVTPPEVPSQRDGQSGDWLAPAHGEPHQG